LLEEVQPSAVSIIRRPVRASAVGGIPNSECEGKLQSVYLRRTV
jgi:hypothetical protein